MNKLHLSQSKTSPPKPGHLTLQPITIGSLDTYANPCDVHRDLHMYLDYMQSREVKRMHRTNELPKADAKRLAKLLSEPEALENVNEYGGSTWLDFIDQLALLLGLVGYDTEGKYMGYTSSEPSFPDNYVIVHKRKYQEFLSLPPEDQEKRILNILIERKLKYDRSNEFLAHGVLGVLDPFTSWGAATGIMPMLDFPSARRFLLEILRGCESGVWYGTASLVTYLKRNHPYFLIPKDLPADRWGKTAARYGNFYETAKPNGYADKPIPDDARDGFERVEGRYVERFLEGIPLVMRYVEVAYNPQPYQGPYPQMNRLQAFRVTPRFLHAMHEEFALPRVTVQPNFEVIIESEIYPARLLSILRPLTEPVSEDAGGIQASVTILALKKERVAAALVQDPNLEVVGLLRKLTERDLPQNVAVELQEWGGHADLFTLYTGYGLLEGDGRLTEVEPFISERVSDNLSLVHSPDKLLAELEEAGLAPLWVEHSPEALAPLPDEARTVFVRSSQAGPGQKTRLEAAQVLRTALIKLRFPAEDVFEAFRGTLLELRCPIEANLAERTITYAGRYQPCVDEAIRSLEGQYPIQVVEG
jgi:hypothetical protein